MSNIPKKVIDRYISNVPKFQKILEMAQKRDIREADTVSIIQDMLAEVFGFDKYTEVTSEFMIKNTYCDLAIKIDKDIEYLIEVKAIGMKLNENHLKQTVDYGANHGVQWVLLTNGIIWKIYKIKAKFPIDYDLVSEFSFLEINPKKSEIQEILFLLSKEGLKKSIRESYYEKGQIVNEYIIASIINSEPIINAIRKELRKMSEGVKIDNNEIEKIIKGNVLKEYLLEGDKTKAAEKAVKKINNKKPRNTIKETEQPTT